MRRRQRPGSSTARASRTTEAGGPRGFDAAKKVNGRKRHLLTDTLGLPLWLVVHAANVQDRDGLELVCAHIRRRFPWLSIFRRCRLSGRRRQYAAARERSHLEIVKRPREAEGFHLLPRRWVIERTFAWLGRNRRLAKDFERLIDTTTAMAYRAIIQLLIRRLASSLISIRTSRTGSNPIWRHHAGGRARGRVLLLIDCRQRLRPGEIGLLYVFAIIRSGMAAGDSTVGNGPIPLALRRGMDLLRENAS